MDSLLKETKLHRTYKVEEKMSLAFQFEIRLRAKAQNQAVILTPALRLGLLTAN